MSDITVKTQPRRGLVVLIVVLGIGLGAAIYQLWQQRDVSSSNRTRIGQLERDGTSKDGLISTLQGQVKTLCGGRPGCAPATAAPQPTATPGAAPPAPVVIVVEPSGAAAGPTPTPRASTTPRPSSSPKPRPSPSASPTCTAVTVGPLRVCPGPGKP